MRVSFCMYYVRVASAPDLLVSERVIFTEDQWDIYKLDPMYTCVVPLLPTSPVIHQRVHAQGGNNSDIPPSQFGKS